MMKLKEDMILYHGSYTIVDKINLDMSEMYKDFGKGFYLTSSKEQANSFVKLSIKKAKIKRIIGTNQNNGYVSIYKLKDVNALRVKYFEEANVEWLHFVVANRDNNKFKELLKQYSDYNVFVGKIANDRTAATLQTYIEGLYGEMGDEKTDNFVISLLLPQRLDSQVCFKDVDAIEQLEFIGYEECK